MEPNGPFKTKYNAKMFAKRMRGKGFVASLYKLKKGWGVAVNR
jgi:hypothetical protein